MSCAEEMSSLLNVFNLSAFGQVVWATVDLIGIVLTIVWYMVVLYGLWKMKDVRYKATVTKQQVSDLQKEIEELKEDLRYEVASTRRLAGMPPTLKVMCADLKIESTTMQALKYDNQCLVEKANDAAKGIREMIPLVNARMKKDIVHLGTTNEEFIRARDMSSKDCDMEVLKTANDELKTKVEEMEKRFMTLVNFTVSGLV